MRQDWVPEKSGKRRAVKQGVERSGRSGQPSMAEPIAAPPPGGRQYHVSVDEHEGLLCGEDSEEGLFLLIEQRFGIPRVAAEPLLSAGKMLFTEGMIVSRHDIFQAMLRDAEESCLRSASDAKPEIPL